MLSLIPFKQAIKADLKNPEASLSSNKPSKSDACSLERVEEHLLDARVSAARQLPKDVVVPGLLRGRLHQEAPEIIDTMCDIIGSSIRNQVPSGGPTCT